MNRKSIIWILLAALALAAGAVSIGYAQEPVGQRSGVNRGTARRGTAKRPPVKRVATARRQPLAPSDEAGTPADNAATSEPAALPDVTSEPETANDAGTSSDETTATPEGATTPGGAAPPEEIVVPGTETDVFEGEDPSNYQQRCTECGGFNCKCAPPVAPPKWYLEADAVWLQPNASGRRKIAQTFATIVVSGIPITGTVERGNAHSLFFKFEPGTRLTVGRHLFRDFLDRDHSLEGTYLGWYDWGSSGLIRAPQRAVSSISFPFAFQSGNLFTPFPTNTAGFGRADFITQQYSSSFQNIELNYRVRQTLTQDRLVASPDGTWEREITPQGIASFLMGFRYIEINERYDLRSTSDILGLFIPTDQLFRAVSQGDYNIRTRNKLFGLQIGGDWVHQHARFNWGGRGKFGLYGNAATVNSDISVRSNIPSFISPSNDIPAANLNPSQSFEKTRGTFSMVGEFGLMASWHLSKHLSFRAAYDWYWIGNIAVAPEQLNFKVGGPITMNTGGFRFLQGPSVGGILVW